VCVCVCVCVLVCVESTDLWRLKKKGLSNGFINEESNNDIISAHKIRSKAQEQHQHDGDGDGDEEETKSKKKKKQKQKQEQKKPLPRGKRTKMKRVKKKYADQDEEDLEIATRLLGLQRPKASPDTGSSGHNGNEEEKKGDGISSSEKKNKQQHSSSSYSKRRPKEEDDEAVEKQTVGIEELDCLTGKPLREKLSGNKKDDGESKNDDKNGSVGSNVHHDDDDDDKKDEDSPPYRILYAVPVCAPFAAVSDYKFKAKVVPGKMKKGKAVKACIEVAYIHPCLYPISSPFTTLVDVKPFSVSI